MPLAAWRGSGFNYMAHWHPEVELCLALSGRIRVGVNSVARDLSPGWIVACASHDIHYYRELDPDSTHALVIFRPELADYPGVWPAFGRRLSASFWAPGQLPEVEAVLRSLSASDRPRDAFSPTVERGLLLQLCGLLDRHATVPCQGSEATSRPAWRDRMAKAIEFIRTHAQDDIGLDDVAAAIGVSPYHLSRNFFDCAGAAFPKYLSAVRLELADDLLADGKLTMLDVALSSGFGSVRSFNRAWRDLRGGVPSRTRTAGAREMPEPSP